MCEFVVDGVEYYEYEVGCEFGLELVMLEGECGD